MQWLETVALASNVLLRFLAYLYLRVLPARFAKFVLPPLFLISTAANVLLQKQEAFAEKETAPPTDVAVVTESVVIEAEPATNEATNDKADKTDAVAVTIVLPEPAPVPTWRTYAQHASDIISGSNIRKPSLNILGNVLLLLAAVDFTAHPFIYSYDAVIFTRVGAVAHNYVKIQARYPGLETNSSKILWRSSTVRGAPWKDGPVLTFTEQHDYVAVAKLTGLYPSTQYEYQLAYPNSTVLPYPAEPIQFRTFPDQRLASGSGTHFKFLVSSCAMPNFPYTPFRGTRVKGFDLLAQYVWPSGRAVPPQTAASDASDPEVPADPVLSTSSVTAPTDPASATPVALSSSETTPLESAAPTSTVTTATTTTIPVTSPASRSHVPTEFMLFIGDFIYADIPWGSQSVAHYRRLYRRMFASPSLRKVYERLPIFTIYDDHEIINNFAGNSNETAQPWLSASPAYHDYLGSANYDTRGGPSYYEFRYGDNAFFVLDTRKYRSDSSVDESERTMLGEQQLAAFHNWLGRVNGTTTWKFVVSSVPLTNLWGYDADKDSWAGFEKERQKIIAALTSVPNVVVLTGDRHQYAVIDYLGGALLEISTSPASQFDMAIPGFPAIKRWESKDTFNKTVRRLNATDLEFYDTVVETPREKILKYVPRGNYKISSIEVDTTHPEAPKLIAELVVNGKSSWQITVHGKPVKISATQALGRQLTQGFKDLLSKVRISPGSWF